MKALWRGGVVCLIAVCAWSSAVRIQSCSNSSVALQFGTIDKHEPKRTPNTAGSLTQLYSFVHLFLDAVQPNSFPKDLLRAALEKHIEPAKVARYEAGYIVCLIIAVLYVLLMPLVGVIFACCRCCGNCGGKVKHNQQSLSCHRNTLATCLGAITIIILAGVILAFIANGRVTENVDPGVQSVISDLKDMAELLSSLPEKIRFIAKEYTVPEKKIIEELKGVGDQIGNAIILSLESSAYNATRELSISAQEAVHVTELLQSINETTATLQSRQISLVSGLKQHQEALQAIMKNCRNCSALSPYVGKLQIDANYSEIPSVEKELKSMPTANLTNLVEKGNKTFHDIPQMCRNQTTKKVDAVILFLDDIQKSIMQSSEQFPSLASISQQITNIQNPIASYGKEVKRYDFYRWAVVIALCCVILFIVVLNVLGLAFGIAGVSSRQQDYHESCLASTGANLLMAGVGFSFIFSWLFMLTVFVTFVVGGNVYTLGCRSWHNKEIFAFLDSSQNLLPVGLNISEILGTNFSFSKFYMTCEEGQSMYDYLHHSQILDFNDILSIDKYSGDLKNQVLNLSVDLSELRLLSDEDKKSFEDFKDSGADKINFTLLKSQLSRPVVKTDLLGFADLLNQTAQLQTDSSKQKLENESISIRVLHNTTVRQQEKDAERLNASVDALSYISKDLQRNINNALQSINDTQNKINSTVPLIVQNHAQCILDRGIDYFQQYLMWAKQMILKRILVCQPLAIYVDNVYTVLCENIIDPWNAFWHCLGWCSVFLIPSIIFAVKTAKYLRPTLSRPSNSFKMEDMFQIPKAKMIESKTNIYANPVSNINFSGNT
uniref:Prominin 2 n=1 Tax=Lepisosteus oculatus TaxID=7918 RepID=W5NE32_LEPOC|nr:PREDICTED: prominin-2 [Lepisosteus oculatus]XP_015202508.1 PREDICTED: prominin-2 [Lepisosteus oculatus]XP_015202565.1 PREDICTED: prominin-2 [Lepisosteus oculatus]